MSTRYIRRHDKTTGKTHYGAYLHGQPDEQPSAYLLVQHYPGQTSQSLISSQKYPEPESIPMGYENGYKDLGYKIHPWHESGLIDNLDYDPPNDNALIRPAEENEQLQLFGYTPDRPSMVHTLVSRNNMGSKISAMTLLGMADLESRKTTGLPLRTSDDLSEHSMRIVKHLGDVGAVPSYEIPYKTTNGYSFRIASDLLDESLPNLYTSQSMHGAEDVTYNASSAKKHVAQILKSGKQKPLHISEQFNQPTLWDN